MEFKVLDFQNRNIFELLAKFKMYVRNLLEVNDLLIIICQTKIQSLDKELANCTKKVLDLEDKNKAKDEVSFVIANFLHRILRHDKVYVEPIVDSSYVFMIV